MRNGFTLIEVMAAILIVGVVLAIGSTVLSNRKGEHRKFVYDIAIQARELRVESKLKNQTNRMAIRMFEDKPSEIVLQSASGSVPVLSDEIRQQVDQLPEDQKKAFLKKFAFDEKKGKKVSFPNGLFVDSVEIAAKEKPIKTGTAYINFFPNGLANEALIVFSDRQTLFWTIAIGSLASKPVVYEKRVTFKDLNE